MSVPLLRRGGRGTIDIVMEIYVEQTEAKQTVHAKRTRQTRARSGPLRAAAGRIKHSPSILVRASATVELGDRSSATGMLTTNST